MQPGSDSGCTAVVAVLKGNELYVANAGDSRCVLCRDGQAVELSLDHKPEDEPEMERIVKAGGEVTSDGRVNGGLNLSRALGDHAYKQNMVLPPQEQMISALPDIRHVTIEPERDEFMVLACDGIWNFMTSQNVVQFVRTRLSQNYDNLSKICEEVCNCIICIRSFSLEDFLVHFYYFINLNFDQTILNRIKDFLTRIHAYVYFSYRRIKII